jgi:hypothetical protein
MPTPEVPRERAPISALKDLVPLSNQRERFVDCATRLQKQFADRTTIAPIIRKTGQVDEGTLHALFQEMERISKDSEFITVHIEINEAAAREYVAEDKTYFYRRIVMRFFEGLQGTWWGHRDQTLRLQRSDFKGIFDPTNTAKRRIQYGGTEPLLDSEANIAENLLALIDYLCLSEEGIDVNPPDLHLLFNFTALSALDPVELKPKKRPGQPLSDEETLLYGTIGPLVELVDVFRSAISKAMPTIAAPAWLFDILQGATDHPLKDWIPVVARSELGKGTIIDF